MLLFESFNFPEFILVIALMIFNPTTIMQLAIYKRYLDIRLTRSRDQEEINKQDSFTDIFIVLQLDNLIVHNSLRQ